MINIFLVGLGGFIGSVARYYIATIVQKKMVGTFIANVTGAIILAFVIHFYRSELITESLWLLLGIGFSGAYTTFSTFSHETLQLILTNKFKKAAIYVSSSFITAFVAVYIILTLLG